MPVDTPRYYEYLHRNPQFAGYDIGYTNNIVSLSQLDNMVTVNNFAQMDLRGVNAAGNVGGRPISSTGGQLQFTLGAMMAKGGRAILAATSRDAKGTSRFVQALDSGSAVTVPDQLVTWICTEYGIVNIMGCTDAEKATKIISIAHPDDRAGLEKGAVREARHQAEPLDVQECSGPAVPVARGAQGAQVRLHGPRVQAEGDRQAHRLILNLRIVTKRARCSHLALFSFGNPSTTVPYSEWRKLKGNHTAGPAGRRCRAIRRPAGCCRTSPG